MLFNAVALVALALLPSEIVVSGPALATHVRVEKPLVAILPILNNSGEKWKDLKERQVAKAHEWLAAEFPSRGFDVIPMPSVLDAIKAAKVDFTDEEEWKRARFFEVGKAAQARYVLFAVITSTDQKKQDRTFYKDIEGLAEIKIWFLDCQSETPILSAKTFVGRSGGARMGDGKGSSRQIQAAANAFDVALKEFFKGFPKTDK